MDQCSKHDTPSAVKLLTDPPGHDLSLELEAQGTWVLTGGRLGDQPSLTADPLPLGATLSNDESAD